jgi:hypothetical protein
VTTHCLHLQPRHEESMCALDVRETNRPSMPAFYEPPTVEVAHTYTLLRTAHHSGDCTCGHQLAYGRKQSTAARRKTAS